MSGHLLSGVPSLSTCFLVSLCIHLTFSAIAMSIIAGTDHSTLYNKFTVYTYTSARHAQKCDIVSIL